MAAANGHLYATARLCIIVNVGAGSGREVSMLTLTACPFTASSECGRVQAMGDVRKNTAERGRAEREDVRCHGGQGMRCFGYVST